MARLLIRHELNQKHVTLRKALCKELLLCECCENVVEEIKLDPFLVKTKENRLVVKVGLDTVNGLGSIRSQPTSWGIRKRLLRV